MAAAFTMIMMCLAVLNVAFAMPAAQPAAQSAGEVTNDDMKTAETSYAYLPYSYGFGAYPRYSPYGYRSGLGVSIGYPNSYSHSFGYSDDYPYYISQFK